MVEDSGFLSNHNCTSTSLGSRINCTNSSPIPPKIAKSPVQSLRKSHFQSSGGISGSPSASGSYYYHQKSNSSSPITVKTLSDGRVERRLETCSYQETEMVIFLTVLLKCNQNPSELNTVLFFCVLFSLSCLVRQTMIQRE